MSKSYALPHINELELSLNTIIPENLTSQYVLYQQSIEALQSQFKIDYPVNIDNIYEQEFVNQLIKVLHRESFQLRRLDKPYTKRYLAWREVLCSLTTNLTQSFDTRREKFGKRLPLKNAAFRSFHISGYESAEAMKTYISQVAPYNWEYLGTLIGSTNQLNGINLDPQHWIPGAENNGLPSPSNLRMWKNRVKSLKTLNLILSDDDDFTLPAVFAVTELSDGGSAILRVQKFTMMSQYSILLAMCNMFTECKIVHTITDHVFIVAIGKKPTTAKSLKPLMKFAEMQPNLASIIEAPYAPELLNINDTFLEIINEIYDYRYEYYHNLFEVIDEVRHSQTAETDGKNMVKEFWQDLTKKWMLVNKF